MNSPHDTLSEVLRDWRVKPPADPNFRHLVWQRIGGRARETWPAYLRSHVAAWALAAVVTLGAAAFTGSAMARAQIRADREALVVTYLVDLDPRVQALLKP
jgi:hypothetical protein